MYAYWIDLKASCDRKIEGIQADLITKSSDLSRRINHIESKSEYELRIVEEQKQHINEITAKVELQADRLADFSSYLEELKSSLVPLSEHEDLKSKLFRDYYVLQRHLVDVEESIK